MSKWKIHLNQKHMEERPLREEGDSHLKGNTLKLKLFFSDIIVLETSLSHHLSEELKGNLS